MSYVCPNGHDSTAADFCDTCGAKIDAAAQGLVPEAAQEATPEASAPAAPTSLACPNCATENVPESLFCEACGYDFTTGAMPRGSEPEGESAPAGESEPVGASEAGGIPAGAPDVVEATVREGLRMTSPASVIGRGVSADVEVAGRQLRAGERVLIMTWAANVAVGPFRIDRPYVPENRQLWFGAGRHLCLGAALARAEIGAVLHTLWDDGMPLRIVSRQPARKVLVPGYRELWVARA